MSYNLKYNGKLPLEYHYNDKGHFSSSQFDYGVIDLKDENKFLIDSLKKVKESYVDGKKIGCINNLNESTKLDFISLTPGLLL